MCVGLSSDPEGKAHLPSIKKPLTLLVHCRLGSRKGFIAVVLHEKNLES